LALPSPSASEINHLAYLLDSASRGIIAQAKTDAAVKGLGQSPSHALSLQNASLPKVPTSASGIRRAAPSIEVAIDHRRYRRLPR